MEKFRVAISGDFVRPDDTPAYPDFDLAPLRDHPNIEHDIVPVRDNRIAAEDLEGFDALILLAARFDRGSVPAGSASATTMSTSPPATTMRSPWSLRRTGCGGRWPSPSLP